MEAISVENLSFKYENKEIFSGLSLNFSEGDFCSVLGPNGSGKTTLLKCMAGLLRGCEGKLSVSGKQISEYKIADLAREISYVPQYQDVAFDIKVFDFVMLGRNPYQKPWQLQTSDDSEIVENAMKRCNVWQFRDKNFQNLSGGEKQRVVIARTIAQNTQIMLLDEPLSNMDVTHKFEIMDILRQENAEKNTTIVIILHDLPIAKQYSDKILLLKDGSVLEFGFADDVLNEENIRKCFDLSREYSISSDGLIRKN